MSKNSRGFAPVLIVIIVGVIGIVSYLALAQSLKQTPTPSAPIPKPTQESPENWKTYTNERDGYSLKYPPSWSKNLESPDYFWKGIKSNFKGASISVFVADAKRGTLADEFRYRTYEHYQANPEAWAPVPYEEISEPEYSKLANEEALRYHGIESYRGNFIGTLAMRGGKTYIVTVTYEDGRKKEFEEIYNQILSTFRFLD